MSVIESTTSLANNPSQALQLIHVVYFEFCSNEQCPWHSALGPHLLISNFPIDLAEEKSKERAIAVSYTWGEFERTERVIGHDSDGTHKCITLGEEWNTQDFINRLVSLSFERGACWMDQFSIPQQDTEVKKALASIPTIYRTLDVVVLMPGAPCRCLREGLDSLKLAAECGTDKDFDAIMFSTIPDMLNCLNFFPFSSWFSRLWTRQELLYSRRISVAWTDIRAAPCVKLELKDRHPMTADEALDLSPFALFLYQKTASSTYTGFMERSGMSCIKEAIQTRSAEPLINILPSLMGTVVDKVLSARPYGDTEAGLRVRQRAEEGRELLEKSKETWRKASDGSATGTIIAFKLKYIKAGANAIREYLGGDDIEPKNENFIWFRVLQFIAGEQLENRTSNPAVFDKRGQVEYFLNSLGRLRNSSRASTQAKDYVNSVWVDCPDFQVHAGYKIMNLPTLLEDALAQLMVNHEVSVVTTIPAGLLGSSRQTGLWKPTLYLSKTAIKDTVQVYGPLACPFKPVPVTKDWMIPLRFTGTGQYSLSSMAVDYENQLSRYPTGFMFHSLVGVMSLWPQDLLERQSFTGADQSLLEYEKDPRHLAIVGKSMAHSISSIVPGIVRASMGTDVHEEMQENMRKHQAANNAFGEQRKIEAEFRTQLFGSAQLAKNGKGASRWNSKAEIDHSRVVYRIVTDVLGLEEKLCRSRGLRLMISRDPACIGLANRDVYMAHQRQRAGEAGYDQTKTICITQGDGISGNILYEVEKAQGQFDSPRYRVFGVWVPLISAPQERIHAIAEAGATNGWIV